MTFFKNLWNDECGASAAEYALILAIVGTGIAIASWTLGGAIGGSIGNAANCIADSSGATTQPASC